MPEGLEDQIAKHLRRKAGVAFDRMAEQVDRNGDRVMGLLGIFPHAPAVQTAIAQARKENIRLVEKAGRAYAGDVRRVFTDPDNVGLRVEELRDLLLERGRVSVSRATTIARTETTKLNAQLSAHRAQAAGLTQFTWSTSKDERVRPEHRELDGQTFEYDDPPPADVDGSPCLPGEAVNCRCIAIPLIPELEETVPEEPQEPDYAAAAEE
jgi:SPP1 gp7 family putative phage head morphogenesis protein